MTTRSETTQAACPLDRRVRQRKVDMSTQIKTWPMPEYKEMDIENKRSLYEAFGPSCNVCKYWYTDCKEEPCLSCTGVLTDNGDYSNFELQDALRPNAKGELAGPP